MQVLGFCSFSQHCSIWTWVEFTGLSTPGKTKGSEIYLRDCTESVTCLVVLTTNSSVAKCLRPMVKVEEESLWMSSYSCYIFSKSIWSLLERYMPIAALWFYVLAGKTGQRRDLGGDPASSHAHRQLITLTWAVALIFGTLLVCATRIHCILPTSVFLQPSYPKNNAHVEQSYISAPMQTNAAWAGPDQSLHPITITSNVCFLLCFVLTVTTNFA